jgi:hypothetical protein
MGGTICHLGRFIPIAGLLVKDFYMIQADDRVPFHLAMQLCYYIGGAKPGCLVPGSRVEAFT